MTDSLYRLALPTGVPTRSTDSLDRSYGRTDGRTHEESLSPSSETSSSVTRARAYGFAEVEIERWLRLRRRWNVRALKSAAPDLARHIVGRMDMPELQRLESQLDADGFASLTAYIKASIDRDAHPFTTVSGGLPTLGRNR